MTDVISSGEAVNRTSGRPSRSLRRLTVTAGAGALLALSGMVAAPASASGADIRIAGTGGLGGYLRPSPDTIGSPVGLVPEGASPDYLCWIRGESVNGVDVWMLVTFGGAQGFYASAYDDSSYASDEEISAKYGIAGCDAGPAPTVTGPNTGVAPPVLRDGTAAPFDRDATAAWALSHATLPQDFAAGCTWFVSQALWAGGVPRTGAWTDAGGHGHWPWSRRPGTAPATAVQPFLDNLMSMFPASTSVPLDLSVNPVPQAQPGDVIAYDWEGDGAYDHLAVVTDIAGDQYPEVAEWGTADDWVGVGHPSSAYATRGWTWSAKQGAWLQQHYPNVTARLFHIDTSTVITY